MSATVSCSRPILVLKPSIRLCGGGWRAHPRAARAFQASAFARVADARMTASRPARAVLPFQLDRALEACPPAHGRPAQLKVADRAADLAQILHVPPARRARRQ